MPYDKKSFILGLATGLATQGVLRNPAKEEQQEGAYLTFSSPEPFTLAVYNAKKNWDGALEYSTDTENWNEWGGTTTLTSGTENKLYLRGTGNTVITGSAFYRCFVLSGSQISCNGDIRMLLEYSDPDNSTMGNNCFAYLFYGCASLVKAPLLQSTKLTNGCYRYMCMGCTGLVSIPKLPATELANTCYLGMFENCTGIRLSEIKDAEYQTPYRIPSSGTGTTATSALTNMFANTGGTFTGMPEINTTYYTSNEVV